MIESFVRYEPNTDEVSVIIRKEGFNYTSEGWEKREYGTVSNPFVTFRRDIFISILDSALNDPSLQRYSDKVSDLIKQNKSLSEKLEEKDKLISETIRHIIK